MQENTDILDQAADLSEKERERALELRRRQRAEEVRMSHKATVTENGDTLCVDCGDPIGKLRLVAYPLACQCIDCKRLEEQGEKRWV